MPVKRSVLPAQSGWPAVSEEMLRAYARRYMDGMTGYWKDCKGDYREKTFNPKEKRMNYGFAVAICLCQGVRISERSCSATGFGRQRGAGL